MKKIFIVFFVMICAVCVYAETYTLKSASMSLSVNVIGKNPVISSIKDLKTGQEFIDRTDPKSNLWTVTVKHNGKPEELPGYVLTPSLAEKTEVRQTEKSLTMYFYNVKTKDMEEGFDVKCYVRIDGNNSYWDMAVSAGKIYGIWEVSYPFINNISTKNGDNFMIPGRGDVFVTEFDNPKGFPDPTRMEADRYTKNYNYVYPKCMQYSSLTKGKSTLYMSAEDTHGTYKAMSWTTDAPNTMNVFTTYFPSYMAEAGHSYKQLNSYNISVFPGDWFDAAKKYRKWGIDSNYAPFAKGKIENRKDLPKWWKDLVWSVRIDVSDKQYMKDNAVNAMKRIGLPSLVHVYGWGAYRFDTHYPDWLPLGEGAAQFMDELKSYGGYIMPYTNAHIVDMNHSETMKKVGSSVLKIKWDGDVQREDWAKELGAENTQACTSGEYYNIYMNEVKNIFKAYDFDAFYMDQVGASVSATCFNREHNHPVGGGTFIHEDYNKMITEIKDSAREIRGKEIAVTTEDGGDDFWFDGWLKCNEGGPKSEKNPVRSVVYSGFVVNFGDGYFNEDYDINNWAVVNKMAAQLTKGYVIGWDGFEMGRFNNEPHMMDYAENAIKARYAAKEYFNFGEMVRPVTITSPIPSDRQTWGSHFGVLEKDYDTVRTCSYYYKGKAMVCFTNASDKSCRIDWKATPESLYLKNKNIYKITEIYPEKMSEKTVNALADKINMEPGETKVFIIE